MSATLQFYTRREGSASGAGSGGSAAPRHGTLLSIGETVGDAELVAAARSGDRQATEVLLTRHYDGIFRLCRRMLGNDQDALDAAQEALVGLVRGLPRFDGRAAFSTWAYRVATNACLDELRRRSRRPAPAGAAGGDDGGPAVLPLEPVPDPVSGVAARLDVDRALARLPEPFRTAVVLRDVCDLSYEEVAAVAGVPVGTVRSRIARGRFLLAGALDPAGDEARTLGDGSVVERSEP